MPESPYSPPKARISPPANSNQRAIERPKEVVLAIWLLVAVQVVGLIGLIFSWDYQVSFQSSGQILLQQAGSIAISTWVYYKTYHGRNWARILFLILVILGLRILLIPNVIEIMMAIPTVQKLQIIIAYSVDLVAIWLLFFSSGRHWFSKSRSAPAI